MANVRNVNQMIHNLLEIINDDSDDSDDEFDMIEDSDDEMEWEYCSAYLNFSEKREHLPRLKNFVEEVIPAFTDKEFKSHFRSICQKFDVSFAAALSSVRRVTTALVEIVSNFIVWPDNEKFAEIANEFEVTSGFPMLLVQLMEHI
ncbi:hypothetical protein KQX54_000608 [Cotesia glomerata]|uniref:Uncharacterized protein n=1 Tax=Cotesia glomerata TaxID=32391 RepID=A0AAV7III3_COTGL|nr:hypothetical protein KQX54_000608 [Cotesia glomerata]